MHAAALISDRHGILQLCPWHLRIQHRRTALTPSRRCDAEHPRRRLIQHAPELVELRSLLHDQLLHILDDAGHHILERSPSVLELCLKTAGMCSHPGKRLVGLLLHHHDLIDVRRIVLDELRFIFSAYQEHSAKVAALAAVIRGGEERQALVIVPPLEASCLIGQLMAAHYQLETILLQKAARHIRPERDHINASAILTSAIFFLWVSP
mmetsp:Transcript_31117/g.58253  ORF Transcript_31117/g.58253 Transcript_31117/m.58253 type:complete len:209 (+) Transcript_31117:1011-1637(+)